MTTTPVGGPGGTHPPEKPTTPSAPTTPSQADAARFSKALDKPKDTSSSDTNRTQGSGEHRPVTNHSSLFRRREAPEQQQQQHGRGDSRGRETEKKDRQDEPSPANAILQNMMAKPVSQVDEAKPVDAPQPVQELNEVVQQVADRILVGESSETGQAEVRITLKDNVLDGTEIRVSENAGAYEITFVAENKDIENFLATRAEQITTALGEKLDKDIKVAVTDRDGTPNQQGDERGRDQGQPGDGRSRNQRSAEDEQGDGRNDA